jgi:very-short-patch-repair endonuclease
MNDVFLGSEAVRRGELTPYELRTGFVPLFPGVHMPNHTVPSLRARTIGAWKWSRSKGVVAGLAAAALHGSDWVDDDIPIELISRNTNPPTGIATRNELLTDTERGRSCGVVATTIERTAFDLGRHLERSEALGRLDALKRATAFKGAKVEALSVLHPGTRGLRQLRELLHLVDPGAASLKESWLRLLLIDDGLPRPRTQIPVGADRCLIGILDMGWDQYKVAAEYDGDQHRWDRKRYVHDQRRLRRLQGAGWIVVRVIAEDTREDILARVRAALHRRGYRDT